MIFAWIFEIAPIHRHRLAPAKEREVHKDGDDRQEERPNGIDVRERVERDAAQHFGGWVTETVRHPTVCRLVEAQAKKHERVENDEEGQFIGHGIEAAITSLTTCQTFLEMSFDEGQWKLVGHLVDQLIGFIR